MSFDAIRRTVSFSLVGVCRAHRNRAAELLAEVGLFVGQEWILLHLRDKQGMSLSELAKTCNVEGPTISKALQRMQKVGLVEKVQDRTDARIARIHLTPAGEVVCEKVDRLWEELERVTLKGLSDEESAQLKRLLRQVLGNFE